MKTDRKEEINNICEYILTHYNYGDVVTYHTLEKLVGFTREEIFFGYTMAQVKKELVEYGCVLSAVLGEGYRILLPNEIAKEVYKRYAKASLKKLGAGLKIMEHIDQDLLSEEERQQFNEIQKVVAGMYRSSENSLLQAQYILGNARRKELQS